MPDPKAGGPIAKPRRRHPMQLICQVAAAGCGVSGVCIRRMTSAHAGRGLEMFRVGDFPIYALTFVRGLSPVELLTRMRVDQETLALRDGMDLSDEGPPTPESLAT